MAILNFSFLNIEGREQIAGRRGRRRSVGSKGVEGKRFLLLCDASFRICSAKIVIAEGRGTVCERKRRIPGAKRDGSC